MKKSFKDQEPPASEADTEELANIEHDEESLPVKANTLPLAIGQVTGDVKESDVAIPRLNIVQGVGELSESFTPGDLVLNRELRLAPKEVPVTLVVLSMSKFFEERLPYDPEGPRPRIFNSEAEIRAEGLWLEWRNDEAPPVREVANLLLAIRQPEDVSPLSFTIEAAAAKWALAVWTVRSTAYGRVFKLVNSRAQVELKKSGLLSGVWELQSNREKVGGNYIFVPRMTLANRLNEQEVKELSSSLPIGQ